MEFDFDQHEFFLDDGWSVVGRLHRWLTASPLCFDDPEILAELIHELQSLWASADDLGMKRISHASLMLEQLLERFCAGTLECTTDRLKDITAGVEILQDLLLGLEATREEPPFNKLEVLVRLQQHATEPIWIFRDQKAHTAREEAAAQPLLDETSEIFDTVDIPFDALDDSLAESVDDVNDVETCDRDDHESEAAEFEDSIESTQLAMLEQFVMKLDDTCHRLHARAVADESPYVSTTTRLEHLIQVTRDLVDQLIRRRQPDLRISLAEILPDAGETDSFAELPGTDDDLSDSTDFDGLEASEIDEAPESKEAVIDAVVIPPKPRHILIIEESMFYRQMLSGAVKSQDFDITVVDSTNAGLAMLKQTQEFCAILFGTRVSADAEAMLNTARHEHRIKVIALTAATCESDLPSCFDDQVARSNPRQLRECLAQFSDDDFRDSRQSA